MNTKGERKPRKSLTPLRSLARTWDLTSHSAYCTTITITNFKWLFFSFGMVYWRLGGIAPFIAKLRHLGIIRRWAWTGWMAGQPTQPRSAGRAPSSVLIALRVDICDCSLGLVLMAVACIGSVRTEGNPFDLWVDPFGSSDQTECKLTVRMPWNLVSFSWIDDVDGRLDGLGSVDRALGSFSSTFFFLSNKQQNLWNLSG